MEKLASVTFFADLAAAMADILAQLEQLAEGFDGDEDVWMSMATSSGELISLSKKFDRLQENMQNMPPNVVEQLASQLLRQWKTEQRGLLRRGSYDGNPDGKPIYDHDIDHGYDQPLAGGTDVMRRLQNQYLREQGRPERPSNPQIPKAARVAARYLDED